jgi:CRISPR-associated endonuclease/helicase Cas3
MAEGYFAHSGRQSDKRDWQGLAEHLENVAVLASANAARFGASEWGYAAGLLHDLGKYSDGFQLRLDGGVRIDHATAGAKEACARYKNLGTPLQYVVAGHHAGLADAAGECRAKRSTLADRLKADIAPYGAFTTEIRLPEKLPPPPLLCRRDRVGFQLALFTRMLFGALVDADYRDTEAHYDRIEGRESASHDWPVMAELSRRLNVHLARFGDARSEVDRLRAEVLAACRNAATGPLGRFTLTVPTGGGKTLASLAFALRHAVAHGLDRVIYVVPFTSVIEQNAQVFRKALGEDAVLEHHSGFDDDVIGKEARDKLRYAAPRFAAPVTVTTAVQFFESLFTDRPGRARKLPSFAKAVIVLDEAQTLPLDLLRPCVAALDELAANYGSTVVLCTATQPALNEADGFEGGLRDVTEIAPDPPRLYESLKRVRVQPVETLGVEALARRLAAERQVLAIVDTKRQAREVFAALAAIEPEGSFHLSTWMCPAHRRQTLDVIRARLTRGEPCRVASTTLIEAGVDVDFPTVHRAECGLDQLAQAAGRCNRNGRRPAAESVVQVFRLEGTSLNGERQRRVAMARSVLRQHDDPLALAAVRAFFQQVYWLEGGGLDAKELMKLHEDRAVDWQFDFAEIALRFRMIDDESEPVLIPFDNEARRLLGVLRSFEDRPPRDVMRKLQSYVVGLRTRELAGLVASGAVQPVGRHERLFELVAGDLYREDVGLLFEDPTTRTAASNIL